MTDILFGEHDQPRELELDAEDWRTVRRAADGLFSRRLGDGLALVGPRQGYVGSLSLRDGRRIVVQPKAPLEGLVGLLALAYRTLAPPERLGPTAWEEAEPNDWFVLL